MVFEVFKDNHIEAAARLALAEYGEERAAVPALPDDDYYGLFCDMLSARTKHGLGVAAMENGELAGFLTCVGPISDFFGNVTGTFSSINEHAARKKDRHRIYSLLYQKACEKWVGEGILSHAVAIYPHDTETVAGFFWNGFGLRCVDAIRGVEPITCRDFPGFIFRELEKEEIVLMVPLKNSLKEHLRKAPCFLAGSGYYDEKNIIEQYIEKNSRYFAAFEGSKPVAFLEIVREGENFVCDDPSMMSICGAYMLPEYRGTGIYTKLLSLLIDTLAKEGFTRCGVDFESLNPTAAGFWLKHFTAYTHSVCRRIDERIIR